MITNLNYRGVVSKESLATLDFAALQSVPPPRQIKVAILLEVKSLFFPVANVDSWVYVNHSEAPRDFR